MADRTPSDDAVSNGSADMDGLASELAVALGDQAVWADVPPDLEDAIVAAIADEAAAMGLQDAATDGAAVVTAVTAPAEDLTAPGTASTRAHEQDADVVDLGARRRWRTIALSAAAVAVLLAGALAVVVVGNGSDGEEISSDIDLTLTATELAPDASAEVGITTTPLGTRIILDVRDVPPAPDGTYYEAWMRIDADTGVSAGTFHLRGGDGTIELWSGVTVDDYPLFTITLQEEGAGAASSGRVLLRGLVEG